MSNEAQAIIDRENCIANHVDPTGRKWTIQHIKHTTLYTIRPYPDREDAVIPDLLAGKYTKPDLAQDKIDLFLEREWDKSDRIAVRNARRAAAPAAPVAEKEESKSVDVGLTEGKSEDAEVAEEAAIADIIAVEEEKVAEQDAGAETAKESLPTESGA